MAIQNRKLTINDIARLAGVSTTTVSRVINNSRGVCKENKQKVMAIIEKDAYRPNLYARLLAVKSNTEDNSRLEFFVEQLEQQGMPKHCGCCVKRFGCIREDPKKYCPWLKAYRVWQKNKERPINLLEIK
jgi:predicted transcriptional regulator